MRVLQIANGYLDSKLYSYMFSALEKQEVENVVYVPVTQKKKLPSNLPENVCVSKCYNSKDRYTFFRKQNKMLRDVESRKLLQKTDLLHAHTVFSGGYLAWRIKKKYGIPYIVAVRNTDVNLFFNKLFFMRPLGVDILSNAERVVFISPAYQDSVIKKYVPQKQRDAILAKSISIPNGISPIFFQKKVTEKKRDITIRLIYVGQLCSNKNFEATVAAVEILRNEGIEAQVVAVGEIIEEKYNKIIEQCKFVTYYKYCSQDEVIRLLQQSDIFVMPSHHETFGLVYAEAMSQGLPIVYTKGEGFDGQFPEGTVGYHVNPNNPEDISCAILTIIKDYEKISRNCLELCRKFDWDVIAGTYKMLYAK